MTDCTWGTFPVRGGWRTPQPPSSYVSSCTVPVVIRVQIRMYPMYSENKDRRNKREKEGEMGKGMLGGVRYVLSACVPLYSSYCITGLALLPHSCRPLPPPYVERRGYPIIHIQYPSRLHFAVHTFPECITTESL